MTSSFLENMIFFLAVLKAPLFPGPEGAGDTNDWCITISWLISLSVWGYHFVSSRMKATLAENDKIPRSVVFLRSALRYADVPLMWYSAYV